MEHDDKVNHRGTLPGVIDASSSRSLMPAVQGRLRSRLTQGRQ